MKRILSLAAIFLSSPLLLLAQSPSANPVSDALRSGLARASKNMVAAAEAMPADKFEYHPTPAQMTFAHLTMHIAMSNNFMCSKISGTPMPEGPKLSDTDGKDKLVAAIKSSFEYCSTALAKVDDKGLGDSMELFGGHSFTKAAAMMILSDDWADHYSAQAMYLRLNDILPPTAQHKM
ncbi:MAG TPA: DinB family protein [Terriglobales bacterium]|nr:DinB family protein [Terriglobales bacterium]